MFQPSSLSTPEGIEVASQLLLDMLRGAQRRAITGSHKAAFAFQDANKSTEANEDANLASVVMNAVLNEATTRFLSTFQSWTLPLLLSYNAELNELFSTAIVNSFPTSVNQYLAPGSDISALLQTLRGLYIEVDCSLRAAGSEGDDDFSQENDESVRVESALHTLSKLQFSSPPKSPKPVSPTRTRSKRSSISIDVEDDPFFAKRRQKIKSSKVVSPSLEADGGIFRQLGMQCPSDNDEKQKLELQLLGRLKHTLETYISRSLGHKHLQELMLSKARECTNSDYSTHDSCSPTSRNREQSPTGKPHEDLSANPGVSKRELNASLALNPILLSSESIRHLRQFSKGDAHMFTIVRNKMKQLSEGFFSRSNQKRLTGTDSEVPVYEAKMTNDTRLVYTIDCAPDSTGEVGTRGSDGNIAKLSFASTYSTLPKMFGIYTHAQINSRLWAAVASWSARRGTEHRKRCLFRQTSKQSGDYFVPGSWPPLPDVYADEIQPDIDRDLMLELHSLLTHEKFVTLTQTVLQGILADEEATHPFSVSHHEHEIIYHLSSCFVIGRSGTGKTTTMLFKMLGVERTSRRFNARKVRQVFITQSRVLAERVEEYFQGMIRSYSTDFQSNEELEWSFKKQKEAEKDLVQLDEEYESTGMLPEKFSELEDKHFPLFLTFDKLCRLLEADLSTDWKADNENSNIKRFRFGDMPDVEIDLFNADNFVNHAPRPQASTKRILFEDFFSKYWPHFPQPAKKGLDPSLVWNEFQGVVRGSEHSLEFPNGAISRDVYESNVISFRKQSTFSRHRPRLYDLFEIYMKHKFERQEYDAADRTHNILRAMRDSRVDISFDYIYVDEVQDNLLIDAKLLRMLCRNPHGLFWAGDTAQQITSTAFRFSDLKAFLHRTEESDPVVVARKRSAIHPKSFTLSINYRSHGGIVNCAHSVVQLLTTLWPDSIDALDREQGLVDGPKPIFFSGWDTNSVHYEQFLFGDASERVEFGAEQCILVRNEAAKERLRAQIGDVGVVMTLYESKGLEFSDVLLYNFFQDSVIKSEWRVVLNAIEEQKRAGLSYPTFDPLRHQGVCSELKFLYVGLTRARNQLWIWDSSPEAESMKLFWESRDQIEVKRPGDDIPHLAVKSTSAEWEKMGRLLFARSNYQQATVCFDRANMPLLRDISKAYHLRKQAKLIEIGTPARKALFLEAAHIFKECAEKRDSQSQICWMKSAECFVEAGDHKAASDAFCEAQEFTRGAEFARKAGAFDRAVEIIDSHDVESIVVEAITAVCQMVFLREHKFRKARHLFESDEGLLEKMDLFGFDTTPVLIDLKRYEDAADIQQQKGNNRRAIELYVQATSESASKKVGPILLEEMWRILPAAAVVNTEVSATLRKLLHLSREIQSQPKQWLDEMCMFERLLDDDYVGLREMATMFLSAGNIVAAIRCYYHLFTHNFDMQSYDFEQMQELLRHLYAFGYHLSGILRMTDANLVQSANTQKLLGYQLLVGGLSQEAVLHPTSSMNTDVSMDSMQKYYRAIRKTEDGSNVVSTENVSHIARVLISSGLKQAVQRHCRSAERARVFSRPCGLNFAGKCNSNRCQWLHAAPEDAKNTINRRLRLFLEQITVINNVDFLLPRTDRLILRSRWISRLLGVVYPHHPEAGKLVDFVASTSDAMVARGLLVLREWVRDGFYNLSPSHPNQTLDLFLVATAFDHYRAFHYIVRASLKMDRSTLSDGYRMDATTGQRRIVLLDLFNGLFSHDASAANSGITYICHILESRSIIDTHSLISILEIIFSLLLAGSHPKHHGLIIPRSWLFPLSQRRNRRGLDLETIISGMLKPLMGLIQDIHRGCDHLTLNNKSIGAANNYSRMSLIERIIRCLLLVGQNSLSAKARGIIEANITTLKGANDDYLKDPILPRRYLHPKTWDELFRSLVKASTFDPLVQIIGTTDTVNAIESVNQVPLDEVFHVVESSPLVRMPPKMRPQASTQFPKQEEPTLALPAIVVTQDMQPPRPADEAINTTVIDEHQLSQSFSEKDQDAARKIQLFYHRYRRRVAAGAKQSPLDRWFEEYNKECNKECSKASVPLRANHRYRAMLRGPLVHFMVCLEAYREHLDQQKRRLSAHAQQTSHEGLEETLARLNKIEGVRKTVTHISHRVRPISILHRFAVVPTLRADVITMTHGLDQFCKDKIFLEGHLELARKGIVQVAVKKAVIVPPKPSLNTSDLLEI
ncbi:hypothetical protein FRC16_010327 [Serendipita sp. 398]|nr:hypothetical protein FRC16_010327 [Serendipita sp. 398]